MAPRTPHRHISIFLERRRRLSIPFRLNPMEGLSFLVRVHNEEGTLEASVRSLFSLAIAYEILIFLHRCTDRSAGIAARLAAENSRVRLFDYNVTLSRFGVETLATDAESEHSFVRFSNWGLQHATYLWKVRWDADFLMNGPLRGYLEERKGEGLWARPDSILRLPAVGLDGAVEWGDYFASCLDHYRKEILWETPVFRFFPERRLHLEAPAGINITHLSRVKTIKPYWFETGWYTEGGEGTGDEALHVRERIGWIESVCGIGGVGTGRSGTFEEAVHIAHCVLDRCVRREGEEKNGWDVCEEGIELQLFWGR